MSHSGFRFAEPVGFSVENDMLYARATEPLRGNVSGGLTRAAQPGSPGQAMPVSFSLIVRNATQVNVTGDKNWAAIRKEKEYVIVEAVTAPNNSPAEWKQIKWSGDAGKPVPGQANQRQLSRSVSKKYHVEVTLGEAKDSVDVWILWATIEVKTKGQRPTNAAKFEQGRRDGTDMLGAVTFTSLTSSIIDESAGEFVDNVGASGKVALVATLSPKGVHKVVKTGWAFERQIWAHVWIDGNKHKQFTDTWTGDTSKLDFLKLTPDENDKIYDLDAPDIRWGANSFEVYHNFRQWIEWGQQTPKKMCSEYALWFWRAQWRLHKDPSKQITLNELGTGNRPLPSQPKYPPRNSEPRQR